MALTSNTRKPVKKSTEEKEDFESLFHIDLSTLCKTVSEVSLPLQEAFK